MQDQRMSRVSLEDQTKKNSTKKTRRQNKTLWHDSPSTLLVMIIWPSCGRIQVGRPTCFIFSGLSPHSHRLFVRCDFRLPCILLLLFLRQILSIGHRVFGIGPQLQRLLLNFACIWLQLGLPFSLLGFFQFCTRYVAIPQMFLKIAFAPLLAYAWTRLRENLETQDGHVVYPGKYNNQQHGPSYRLELALIFIVVKSFRRKHYAAKHYEPS